VRETETGLFLSKNKLKKAFEDATSEGRSPVLSLFKKKTSKMLNVN